MIRYLRSRLVYPYLAAERYRGIQEKIRIIREFEDLAPQQQLDQQWSYLKNMLQHAYDSVPYYREIMDAHNLPPSMIRSMDDYCRLPELKREIIRERRSELISQKYEKSDLRMSSTGGTTSTPVAFYRDVPGTAMKIALQWRLNELSGYRLGDTALWMWGAQVDFAAQPSWKWSLLEKYGFGNEFLPIRTLDDVTFAGFVREIRKTRPRIIYGFPNIVEQFAKYVLRNQCALPSPAAVICSAESLSLVARKNIETALGSPVHNHYGSRETGMVAIDLAGKAGMRFHGFGCLVEFIPVQRTTDGWIARLVLTDLLNRGMPFLRHDTSDFVLVRDSDLLKSSAFPTVDDVQGRFQDSIILPLGRIVPGTSITASLAQYLPDLATIRALQIVQEAIGHITLRYVAVGDKEIIAAELKDVERLLRGLIPDRFSLSFQRLDTIPVEASGKYRVVVSKVNAPSMPFLSMDQSALAQTVSA